jgi:ADP-ribose pyrophosphatase YjhB (NUDIX family)
MALQTYGYYTVLNMENGRIHNKLQHADDSQWARYCPSCGGPLEDRYIESEQHIRKICTICGFIFYLNPKVVAAAIPRQGGTIWLVRRSVEPAAGHWTFPGGYVDLGERVPDAAIRETYEETRLNVRLDGFLNLYSYENARIVLVVYRATVIGGTAGITTESQEVQAFPLDAIPWPDLAFPSTRDALADYLQYEMQALRQS